MKKITRDELKSMMDNSKQFTLIETLPQTEFNNFHLPGAINIPIDASFEKSIQQRVPDKRMPTVVYCKNSECDASEKAAEKMESLGYTNVYDYAEGKEDWKSAKLQTA